MYGNKFNKIKRICKENLCAKELALYQDDLKKIWKTLRLRVSEWVSEWVTEWLSDWVTEWVSEWTHYRRYINKRNKKKVIQILDRIEQMTTYQNLFSMVDGIQYYCQQTTTIITTTIKTTNINLIRS